MSWYVIVLKRHELLTNQNFVIIITWNSESFGNLGHIHRNCQKKNHGLHGNLVGLKLSI